jgi:hypothetical protein
MLQRRFATRVRKQLLLASLFPLLATAGAAQEGAATKERNHYGLSAGAAAASTWVGFDGGGETQRGAGRLDLGYRFPHACVSWLPLLCWQRIDALRPLRLTAGLTFVATDVRGMNPANDRYAYSNVDFGLRASYPVIGPMRVFVEARQGKKTAELVAPDSANVWNYYGNAVTTGAGVEIPITPRGRGLEVGVSRARGRFDTYEYLEDLFPADRAHSAWMVHVGWSGPFTGVSLPWQ